MNTKIESLNFSTYRNNQQVQQKYHGRPMKVRLLRVIIATIILLGGEHAYADAVTDWNAIMQQTVASSPDPFIQLRSAAIIQLAVFEAVNAIIRDYEPYLDNITAPPGA